MNDLKVTDPKKLRMVSSVTQKNQWKDRICNESWNVDPEEEAA